MAKILEVLKEFCKKVEKDNPYNLVLKGGTALALYYFNHRESEDLDFDVDIKYKKDYLKIKNYFENIFSLLIQRRLITDYRITKADFATTNRYHIKVELKTGKAYYSKIDVDFVELPKDLVKKGELNLYSVERVFVGKSLAFINRKEFKDIYDLAYLINRIKIDSFHKKKKVAELLDEVISVIQQEDMERMFRLAFRNVDLRFKNLKEHQLSKFLEGIVRKLRVTANQLKQ